MQLSLCCTTSKLATAAALLGLAGCPRPAPVKAPDSHPARVTRLTMEPILIVAHRVGDSYTSEAYSASDLFRRGVTAQRGGKCKQALAAYAKLLRHFKGTAYGPPSHYNSALCLQRLGRWKRAGEQFEAASRTSRKASEQIMAMGAAGVSYGEAKSWADSIRCFARLLARTDLKTHQRIEAHARLARAWFRSGKSSRARNHADRALAIYRKTRATVRLPSLHYVAMAAYFRAAIFHRLASQTPIRLPAEQMAQDVEAMATWMYKAQKAYWHAVSYKDHYWAMASTYQVGTLYWEFRRALVGAPMPRFVGVRYFDKTLKRYETITAAEQRTAYLQKLRRRTRVLLRHAMVVYQKGLSTAERIGAKNRWVERMRKALAAVKLAYRNDPHVKEDPDATPRPSKIRRSPLVPRGLDPDKYHPSAVEM